MPASIARPALRAAAPHTRFVYTEHNRWDRFSAATRTANMVTFPLNQLSYAVSDDCRESIPPALRSRVSTLIHGIDVGAVAARRADRERARTALGVGPEEIVVGTVANLRRQKNYPLLLEVARRVTQRRGDVVFLAVGQGPLRAELDEEHRRLGLADRFRFLGFRSDVHSVMSAFDVFCLASEHEGLPVALMEARALGLPVVATSVGGVTGAVRHGHDGELVPSRDAAALTAAIERVAADRALRSHLAAGSAAAASLYCAESPVRQQESAYLELLSR
jgi:glycosyltransferase involved in cell wall biosynthesis